MAEWQARAAQASPRYILAPYVATPPEIVAAMIELAGVGAHDIVYDIGCGDGRMALAAAGRGARAVGIDVEPAWVAHAAAAAAGASDRVEFECGDATAIDLQPATVVLMYLVEWSTRRMAAQVVDACAAGTRVVSHNFDLGDLVGGSTHEVFDHSGGSHRLHLWVNPGRSG